MPNHQKLHHDLQEQGIWEKVSIENNKKKQDHELV